MLTDVQTKSGTRHNAGDIVLVSPCKNADGDKLMVVRPTPKDEHSMGLTDALAVS